MVSICSRLIFLNLRHFSSTAVRYDRSRFPDPLELATGLEKKELLARLAGNDDPYMCRPIAKRESSRENPIIVESAFDSRLVGCICHEDQTYICYFHVLEGEPSRCECGFWFKLCRKTPITG
ncbi:cytochrome c oxidase subunit 5B, mitochondrial-like [Belonocnema kinseyi]|uniref:cytochrome c oxidase subunit 5B, mitochondrial-like n=1 Tax=Belonocnema kinseyi TaxID=2817044 RepID=UPI00143D3323|nr:cytochrome c oxidase subunit 5B, mitochondrial-like [Belonocnema kinseyi]